jgi:hypothetical protein
MNAVAVIGSGLLVLVGAVGASAQPPGASPHAQVVQTAWGDVSGERDEVEAPRAAVDREAVLTEPGLVAATVVAAAEVTSLPEGEDLRSWMPTDSWGTLSTEHDEFEAP